MRRFSWMATALVVCLALVGLVGCSKATPEERVDRARARYEASVNGFVVQQRPLETAPPATEPEEGAEGVGEAEGDEAIAEAPIDLSQDVLLDIVIRHESFEKLDPMIAESTRGTAIEGLYDEYGPVRMIRNRTWKYVHRYPYGPHELYDLANDPGELTNLVDDEGKADIRRELKAGLDEWFDTYVDPRVDGTHEGVTGGGQLCLAGPAGKGARTYA